MLKREIPKFYKVKKGQTLKEIADAFCVSPRLLVKENCLKKEVWEGQILQIPEEVGNVYTAKAGDTPTLLCGSEENFRRKNGTDQLYPGMFAVL